MSRTGKQHHDGRLTSEAFQIQVAAATEALALSHPEADVEHLLIGLLVAGGPSARVLTGAGEDLQSLRRALSEVQQLDLDGFGVTGTAQRTVLHANERDAALAVPVSGRAQDLLDAAPRWADDRALLVALLDDEGGRARRLLEHLGIDAQEVREQLGSEHVPTASAPVPSGLDEEAFAELRGPAPTGSFWIEASWSQELPMPVEKVWALVSDPSRRPEWDPSTTSVTVTADGLEQLSGKRGDARTQRVTQLEPCRAIAWRQRGTGTATLPVEATEQVLQLVLEPGDETTRVHLRHRSPGRGRGVRLSRPLLVRMMRTRLRFMAQAIAQSA